MSSTANDANEVPTSTSAGFNGPAGGCSGFEYTFGWETSARPGDSVFEGSDGARVFVDAKSLKLLDGTVLDYDTSLLSKGFTFSNPHATGTCGCGVSFSVREDFGQ